MSKLRHFRFENFQGTQNSRSVDSIWGLSLQYLMNYPMDLDQNLLSYDSWYVLYVNKIQGARNKVNITARYMVKFTWLQYLDLFSLGTDGSVSDWHPLVFVTDIALFNLYKIFFFAQTTTWMFMSLDCEIEYSRMPTKRVYFWTVKVLCQCLFLAV